MRRFRRLPALCLPLVVLVLLAALLPAAHVAQAAQSLRPKTLLIYYGKPSLINSADRPHGIEAAATEFGRYDYVVLGDGLERPAEPEHQATIDILAQPALADTVVFGYIDLGVSTQNLSLDEVRSRIDAWQAMGVQGVLLDDFGYDFGTTRARQNAAVDYAHQRGMRVVANAFRPADVFGTTRDPLYNPAGTPTRLNSTDFYLYESHQISVGAYESETAWQTKATTLQQFQRRIGFRILSNTTPDSSNGYEPDKFAYAWYSAVLYGHTATGWSEYGYSAFGPSYDTAPFREPPETDLGRAFTTEVVNTSPAYLRDTNWGRIVVNTAASPSSPTAEFIAW